MFRVIILAAMLALVPGIASAKDWNLFVWYCHPDFAHEYRTHQDLTHSISICLLRIERSEQAARGLAEQIKAG